MCQYRDQVQTLTALRLTNLVAHMALVIRDIAIHGPENRGKPQKTGEKYFLNII